jgi:tetratricopeptide (TPR) repeat protein
MQLRKAVRQYSSRAVSIVCLGLCALFSIPLRTAETRALGLERIAVQNIAQRPQEVSCELLPPPKTERYEHFAIAYGYALHQIGGLSWRQAVAPEAQRHDGAAINITQAIDCFRLVVSETPFADAAWNDLAWLYLINNDPDQALYCAHRALGISRVDYTYYITLGIIEESMGHAGNAGEGYSDAISLYPRLIRSPFWQELKLRNGELAGNSLDAALTAARANYLHDYAPFSGEALARLLLESDNPDAERLVRNVLARLPTVPGAWELLGEISWSKGDQAEAQRDFRRAIFINPDDPLPRELLARLSLASNDIATASEESYRAWRLQLTARTPHSRRAVVEYKSNAVLQNDVLPPDIFNDLSPRFPFSSFFREVATRWTDLGRDNDAARFSRLADSAAP